MSEDLDDDVFEGKPQRPKQVLATTELGFDVDVKAKAVTAAMRGNYDVTRLQRDHPQLVELITWLLSLPGMTWDAIAKAAGISWESVAAIAAAQKEPIREFKLRQAKKLGLVLDATLGGLLQKAARGELSAFDYKMMADAWLQMSGEGQTLRVETTKEDPKRASFRRFLEGAGASPMVLEAEEISQSGPALGLPSGEGKLALNGGQTESESVVFELQHVGNQQSPGMLGSPLAVEAADGVGNGAGGVGGDLGFEAGGEGGQRAAPGPPTYPFSAGEFFSNGPGAESPPSPLNPLPDPAPEKKEGGGPAEHFAPQAGAEPTRPGEQTQ